MHPKKRRLRTSNETSAARSRPDPKHRRAASEASDALPDSGSRQPPAGLDKALEFLLWAQLRWTLLHAEALRSTRETVLAACGREVPAAAS